MTINYTFKITSVNKTTYTDENNYTFTDVITKINYYYLGIDDSNLFGIYNSSIDLPKPTKNDYKSYNELTENDLISWIDSLIPHSELKLMQSVIKNIIDDSKTKTNVFPWISS